MADIQRLGEYRVDREIARSTIASIYEGYQESLDRKVLIKRLHPQLVGDEEIRSRFEREARAIARLKHKNVVHIYDYRADNDLILLVSEWIGGGSVEELVRKDGRLTEREAVALCIDVLEGLAAAHEMGIIHRDIKPSNLLISTSGAIKITDFGLAQFEGAPSLTQQGTVMGTPAYMAPELISGIPADARSDLYNLGVTVYELLTGVNPFRSESMSQTLNLVMSLRPEPLEGVHDQLNQFLLAMMDKKPERRPATAREALNQLRALGTILGVERGWSDIERTARDREESKTDIRPAARPIPHQRYVVLAFVAMFLVTIYVIFIMPPYIPEPRPINDTTNILTPPPVAKTIRDTTRSGTSPAQSQVEESRPSSPPVEQREAEPEPVKEMVDESGGAEDTTATDQPIEVAINHASPDTSSPVPVVLPDGYLYLAVHPWANVYRNDQLLVQTPYNRAIPLPAGQVELTLINPEFPPVLREVFIPSADTLRIRINLFDEVGTVEFLDATPWAEVYLDGEYLGRTPIGRPVFVRPGQHSINFRHPTLSNKTITFDITAGGEPKRFHVDLTE
ncbi:protein kinase [bacterium]|nr:protein kinase [bacterium]